MQCWANNIKHYTYKLPISNCFISTTYLRRIQIKEKTIIDASIRLGVRQYFARILGDKGATRHIAHRRDAPALGAAALDHLQRHLLPVLHDPVFALQLVAAAHVVALENHGRIGEIKGTVQSTLGVVPVLHGNLAALATG